MATVKRLIEKIHRKRYAREGEGRDTRSKERGGTFFAQSVHHVFKQILALSL
jgi:hypothetical protein